MGEHEPLTQRDLLYINQRFDNLEAGIANISSKQDYTNGRVTALERTNIYFRGFGAALAFIVGLPALVGTILGVVIGFKTLFG